MGDILMTIVTFLTVAARFDFVVVNLNKFVENLNKIDEGLQKIVKKAKENC